MTSPKRFPTPINESTARVAVVIPVRNQVESIRKTLDCVLNQTFPLGRLDIFVADGRSDDGTRDVIEEYAAGNARIHLVDNPAQTIPVGLNLAIAAADADVVVRVDGRAFIAPDYVQVCVELLASSGAANVGGLMRPEGRGTFGEAVALATKSRFGIGNGRFHYLERQEWVDTVYLGAFRREVLEEVGNYDEELIRNQDDELNYRIRAAGFGILLSPRIMSSYIPARTLRQLWSSQYYLYGYWKIRVIQKHPRSIQLKHLVPPSLVAGLMASTASYLVFGRKLLLFPVALYLSSNAAASMWIARRERRLIPVVPVVLACMHVGYGCGFIAASARLARAQGRKVLASVRDEGENNVP